MSFHWDFTDPSLVQLSCQPSLAGARADGHANGMSIKDTALALRLADHPRLDRQPQD
jgi:hypothetical protein